MSMMMTELYDALTNAGADETRARDAATAVAAWGDRFNSLEGKVNLLQWMAGFNLALTTAILWRVFS
jgi:hypothetical protein